MATFNKVNLFSQDLCRGSHNFQSGGNSYLLEFSNTATVATNHLYSDISANELANGNGYTTGGLAMTMSDSTSGGVETVAAANVVLTATGSVGPFRYVTVYNNTTSSPAKPLVCWFDYGSSLTLAVLDTFTVSWPSGFFTAT